jgi:hypothetical protein
MNKMRMHRGEQRQRLIAISHIVEQVEQRLTPSSPLPTFDLRTILLLARLHRGSTRTCRRPPSFPSPSPSLFYDSRLLLSTITVTSNLLLYLPIYVILKSISEVLRKSVLKVSRVLL